jgi:hypothetical protein
MAHGPGLYPPGTGQRRRLATHKEIGMNRMLAIGLGLALAGSLSATAARADATGDAAAVQNFRLSDGFLEKYQAVEADVAKDPCRLGAFGLLKSEGKSLDQTAAEYDAQPGVHAMLARHGLTARETLLGMAALMSAAMEDLRKAHPEMVQKDADAPAVSPANMAFYQSHKDGIRQREMQLAQQMMQANHGKLPACLAH